MSVSGKGSQLLKGNIFRCLEDAIQQLSKQRAADLVDDSWAPEQKSSHLEYAFARLRGELRQVIDQVARIREVSAVSIRTSDALRAISARSGPELEDAMRTINELIGQEFEYGCYYAGTDDAGHDVATKGKDVTQ